MRILLFIVQISLGNKKNDLRWAKEREFSWVKEVQESSSEMIFAMKGQSGGKSRTTRHIPVIRVIHAIFNSIKGICASMCELQHFNSFNSGLLLVYWYIFTGGNDREP